MAMQRRVLIALLIFFNITLRRQIPHNDIQRIIADWGRAGSLSDAKAHYPTDFSRGITPIPCHSHNDYRHRVPLYDALSAGCISVEADVWLSHGDLLVGHSSGSLTTEHSLRSLYIDPLVSILARQNSKSLSDNHASPPFPSDILKDNGVFEMNRITALTLLVDVKTEGHAAFPLLTEQLEPLRSRGWLTHFNGSEIIPSVITVVGGGEMPFESVASSSNASNTTVNSSSHRDIFFDAPLDQLWGEKAPANNALYTSENSYYASASFAKTIGKLWYGTMTPSQVAVIRAQVAEANKRGLKARYWDTPSLPIATRDHVWDVLEKEGVGGLNVDDLDAASKRAWGK